MAGMRWGRRVASAIVLVGLVAIGLGRGVGAQTGPAFSAQIQLALRALLAGDQTITGNWTCSGTCSGFGGGGGGTPAGPDTSVQFNNGGSFGGSSSLTWDGTTLLGNSFVTAATDTGSDYQGNPVKLHIQTATAGHQGMAFSSANIGANYGAVYYMNGDGSFEVDSGLLSELWMVATPSDSTNPATAYSWGFSGDVVPLAGGNIGRASNPWAAVYANTQQFTEISAPSAPSANQGRLFLQDNGAGKSQLCVRFNTGAAQCFATEP